MSVFEIDDLNDKIEEMFNEASAVKTEASIVTYDEDSNVLQSEVSEYELKMTRSSIDDEKELNRFIKKCESMIRMSPEYKDWTDYIRDVMEMTSCQLTGEHHDHAKSDIHHHPITLFVIVKAVILKNVASDKEFSSISIMQEVVDLHYKMKIPFVVLIKSLHERFHNGFLNIPIELCIGDVQSFIKDYSCYLDEEDVSPILDKLKINWNNCGYSKFKYKWSEKD